MGYFSADYSVFYKLSCPHIFLVCDFGRKRCDQRNARLYWAWPLYHVEHQIWYHRWLYDADPASGYYFADIFAGEYRPAACRSGV